MAGEGDDVDEGYDESGSEAEGPRDFRIAAERERAAENLQPRKLQFPIMQQEWEPPLPSSVPTFSCWGRGHKGVRWIHRRLQLQLRMSLAEVFLKLQLR